MQRVVATSATPYNALEFRPSIFTSRLYPNGFTTSHFYRPRTPYLRRYFQLANKMKPFLSGSQLGKKYSVRRHSMFAPMITAIIQHFPLFPGAPPVRVATYAAANNTRKTICSLIFRRHGQTYNRRWEFFLRKNAHHFRQHFCQTTTKSIPCSWR